MYDVLGHSQGIPDSHVVCLARSVWEFVVGDFLGNTFQTVGMLARCFWVSGRVSVAFMIIFCHCLYVICSLIL